MADQFEIAHRTPSRTRLRWCGTGAPPQPLLASLAASPAVRRVDYRPATGSLVLLHEVGFGPDQVTGRVEELGFDICEKTLPPPRPRRTRPEGNGAGRTLVLSEDPAAPDQAGSTSGANKWTPIVADVEAVVLLGLILGWIRDWLAGRNLAFGTVVLVLLSGIALFQFWWRRQCKKEAAEPELEFIYA